jgi:hypothetical protein
MFNIRYYQVIGPNSDYTPATKYYMEQYATDMRLCLDYLEAANADATSFLYGKVYIIQHTSCFG